MLGSTNGNNEQARGKKERKDDEWVVLILNADVHYSLEFLFSLPRQEAMAGTRRSVSKQPSTLPRHHTHGLCNGTAFPGPLVVVTVCDGYDGGGGGCIVVFITVWHV